MSDPQAPNGYYLASDGKWYPVTQAPAGYYQASDGNWYPQTQAPATWTPDTAPTPARSRGMWGRMDARSGRAWAFGLVAAFFLLCLALAGLISLGDDERDSDQVAARDTVPTTTERTTTTERIATSTTTTVATTTVPPTTLPPTTTTAPPPPPTTAAPPPPPPPPPTTAYVPPPTNALAGVYYRNCDAARAAGAAPVYRGDPGYAPHLDRDNDGVGCE